MLLTTPSVKSTTCLLLKSSSESNRNIQLHDCNIHEQRKINSKSTITVPKEYYNHFITSQLQLRSSFCLFLKFQPQTILTAARFRVVAVQDGLDALEELPVHGLAIAALAAVLAASRAATPPATAAASAATPLLDGRTLTLPADQIGPRRFAQHDVHVRRRERPLGLLALGQEGVGLQFLLVDVLWNQRARDRVGRNLDGYLLLLGLEHLLLLWGVLVLAPAGRRRLLHHTACHRYERRSDVQ